MILYTFTNITITIYLIITDSKVFELPGISREQTSFTMRHILQTSLVTVPAQLLTVSDAIFIYIALYFASSLNILLDCIGNVDSTPIMRKNENFILYLQFYHLKIIKNLQLFSDMLYYVFVIQFSTNFFFLLIMFFMIGRFQDMYLIYPLVGAVFFQLSILCFFGEFIIGRTENVFRELYMTKWYEFSKENKSILLIMMIASQKPFSFKAAKMYDVNLVMLVQVIKITFSYCTILYSLT